MHSNKYYLEIEFKHNIPTNFVQAKHTGQTSFTATLKNGRLFSYVV